MENKKTRINKILKKLNNGLHEREEINAVALLAALADQNIFLLGPPGTAKSLVSRRLSHAFQTDSYFEYLMQKFSTPEEIFGPISISELKQDNYIRKTEDFLPTSDFAFLDEIWKSGPAILNTLLTIINEKKFKNGRELVDVPLKVLISASNETPPKGQGLEALYDRFLVRLYVPPMHNKNNFESLLQAGETSEKIDLKGLSITHDEWKSWKSAIKKVKLSKETYNIISDIRLALSKKGKQDLGVYVSDRRWQKAAHFLKTAAFFCDRKETNLVDALLLKHCLWTTEDNRDSIIKIVEDAVRNSGFETGFSLKELDDEKDDLDKEINKELFHSTDIYKTITLGIEKKAYYKSVREFGYKGRVTFYIPVNKKNTKKEFHPVDKQGEELEWIKCEFDNQGSCNIKTNIRSQHDVYYSHQNHNWEDVQNSFTPKVLFHKGDKKTDINLRLIKELKTAVKELAKKIQSITQKIEKQSVGFKKELDTPFVLDETRDIALESVTKQIKSMKLRHKDCERLMGLIGK
ncbi:MoxR-like ATPase [uncultured Candidatus Thioglobus sp.]|nr:MoxR-like ATPase [uncultured Candidatus Thioglobus sp.]